MIQPKIPKLFWWFALILIGYFPTSGMYSTNHSMMDKAYELDELREEFRTILELQPEFIHLESTESQYKASNGIYKLIPYYQKLFPELSPTDIQSSRFIINKHVITGQWQLTEIYDLFWSRNIKAFPVTKENEIKALRHNRFVQSQNRIQELEEVILNLETEVKFKTEAMQFFINNQNELLYSILDKFTEETNTQMRKKDQIQKEMKYELIEKETQIRYLLECQNELTSKLTEKENELYDIKNAQNQLESKVLQKENQLSDFEKIGKEFQTKLLEHKNMIQDLKKQKLETITKSEEDLKLFENENQKNKNKSFKYQNLIEKLETENDKLKLREKLLDNEIEDLYVTNCVLKNKLKETKDTLQKYQSHAKENVLKFTAESLQNVQKENVKETGKLKILNSNIEIENKNYKLNETLELDFEIKINIFLNYVDMNTKKMEEEKYFDLEIEFEELKIPKIEKPLTSKQSKGKKKKSRLNLQSNDEKIEQKLESIQKENCENEKLLENKILSKEKNLETKPLDKTPKKQDIGLINLLAQIEKQKEDLQYLRESQIGKKQELSILKGHKKNDILESAFISNQNFHTSQKEETKFEDGLIKMTEIQKSDMQISDTIDEEKRAFKSKDHCKNENKYNVKHVELKFVEEQLTDLCMQKEKNNQMMKFYANKLITQTLHGSRPSDLKFEKINLDKSYALILKKKKEHEVLVEGACKRLRDLNDKELSRIRLFLENKNDSKNDKAYRYELLFMHHGATLCLKEKFISFKSQKNFTIFAKNYCHALEKIHKKHEELLLDTIMITLDRRTQIKFKCFDDKPSLYYEVQYKYEMILMTIGMIYGAGDILNELVNQTTTLL